MDVKKMTDSQYGLLFAVRRSIRYHDRRRAYFDLLHRLSAGLTVLLASSVLFDATQSGESPWWMIALAFIAAPLAAWDIVIGYTAHANVHLDLKKRWIKLEAEILSGKDDEQTWNHHETERLRIESDEPPVYRALDLLCHNEVARAEGVTDPKEFEALKWYKSATRHLWPWANITSAPETHLPTKTEAAGR